MLLQDYNKYTWFLTNSGILVVAGKSAVQNDELLKRIKSMNREFIVMHTNSPGSPFSIILEDPGKVTKEDMQECAIFTASFSRAWRLKKKGAIIDLFKVSQLSKPIKLKVGTWIVKGKVERKEFPLGLVLTVQEKKLRAVPEKTVKLKRNVLLNVFPGEKDKTKMTEEISKKLNNKFSREEILAALPAGGVSFK